MAKRKDTEMVDLNPQRKRVRIESLVPVPPQSNGKRRVSHPSLISFTQSMRPETIDGTKVRLVHREGEPKDEGDYEMVAENGGSEWRARKGYNEMNLDYFIGIRNKKTNTLSLIAIDGMYSLRPYVCRRRPDDETTNDSEEKQRTYAEQRADLLETFGGRKSQKRVEKYMRDRITEDNVDDKTQIHINVAAKEMLEKDTMEGILHHSKQTTESMAPPHDNDAASPELAYPLEGLISHGELSALEQEARAMIQMCADGTGNFDNPGWHPLVWKALLRITDDKELTQAPRIRQMQAAMHLHYLIVLANASHVIKREGQLELMELMAVDEGVLKCILSRFTVNEPKQGKHVRRKTAADIVRTVVYGIVMWLTACGFSNCGELRELSAALGVSAKLLVKHAMQIGCKVRRLPKQKDAGDYLLSLKVPLTFPKVQKRQGRPARRS